MYTANELQDHSSTIWNECLFISSALLRVIFHMLFQTVCMFTHNEYMYICTHLWMNEWCEGREWRNFLLKKIMHIFLIWGRVISVKVNRQLCGVSHLISPWCGSKASNQCKWPRLAWQELYQLNYHTSPNYNLGQLWECIWNGCISYKAQLPLPNLILEIQNLPIGGGAHL